MTEPSRHLGYTYASSMAWAVLRLDLYPVEPPGIGVAVPKVLMNEDRALAEMSRLAALSHPRQRMYVLRSTQVERRSDYPEILDPVKIPGAAIVGVKLATDGSQFVLDLGIEVVLVGASEPEIQERLARTRMASRGTQFTIRHTRIVAQ